MPAANQKRAHHGPAGYAKKVGTVKWVALPLSETEQRILDRLARVQTKFGPTRISAADVVRGLLREAARRRR